MMTQILVQPPQLRQTAEQLRAHAQKIDQALRAIDDDIRSLKGHHFLGHRADAVQVHYAPKREALLASKELVLRFSEELDVTAEKFDKADRTEGMSISVTNSPENPKPPYNNLSNYMQQFHLYQGDTEWCSTYSQLMLLHAMGIDIDFEDLSLSEKMRAMFDFDYLVNKYGVDTEKVSGDSVEWLKAKLEQNKGVILQVKSDILWTGEDTFSVMPEGHVIIVTGVVYDTAGNITGYQILDPATTFDNTYTISPERLEAAWTGRGNATVEPVISKNGAGSW